MVSLKERVRNDLGVTFPGLSALIRPSTPKNRSACWGVPSPVQQDHLLVVGVVEEKKRNSVRLRYVEAQELCIVMEWRPWSK